MRAIEVEFKVSDNGGYFTVQVDDIRDVRDGFWVDKDGCIPDKLGDSYYFILPNMISYLMKIIA